MKKNSLIPTELTQESIKVLFSLLAIGQILDLHAAGGFEKPVLWSARAAQHAGAYAASVQGAESLFFNPASLKSTQRGELFISTGLYGGSTESVLPTDKKVSEDSDLINTFALLFSQSLNSKDSIGVGLYSIGGLSVAYDDINLSGKGSEFNSYKPDIIGNLGVLELGLGYSREVNSNFSLGLNFRNHFAQGGFSQVQVSEARGLGGMGIPDGTTLAISNAEFKDLKGFSFGSFSIGGKYQSDDKSQGLGIVYRSKVSFDLRSQSKGSIVYSNTGAAASGTTAGTPYKLSGTNSTVSSSLPQSLTLSYFNTFKSRTRLLLEYTWTQYSENKKLGIDGSLTNTADSSKTEVADVNLNWHDMHDFKIGLLHKSENNWEFGGGYNLTLPVTDKNHAGVTFAAPGNYHHFYTGLGKILENYRVDTGLEYYFGSGKGKSEEVVSGNMVSPSTSGEFKTKAMALFLSTTISI